ATVGANCTLTEVLWLGDSVSPPPPLVMLNPEPVALTPEIETLELPVLVTLKLCEELEPSVTEPKLRLPGLTLSVRVAATPVPLRAPGAGESGGSLTTVREPVAAPAGGGAYCTLSVLAAPGASVNGTPAPLTLNPDPLAATWETVRLAVPLFFS